MKNVQLRSPRIWNYPLVSLKMQCSIPTNTAGDSPISPEKYLGFFAHCKHS